MQGRAVRVELDTGCISEQVIDERDLIDFVGGRGLGVKLLFDLSHPGVEPLSPENPLIITVGPLTGIAPLSGRHSIVSKSPLTGTIFDSNGGGYFGRELKYAGIDALIITGASEHPVYLAIDDESIELRDASHLWGGNVRETTDALKGSGRVACIGRAGERLALIAGIMNDYVHTCGRGGLGAVMGSKKLKAIVVRGSGRPLPADPDAFEVAKSEAMRLLRASPVLKGLNAYGTPVLVNLMNYMHILPTKNFNYTHFEEAERLSGEYLREHYELKNHACANCFVACKHSDRGLGVEIPEYESLWALGPDNQNSDVRVIIEANRLCNEYGIDTISAGSTIACYSEIVGRTPSSSEIPELVRMIGEKTGIGAELSVGSRRYAMSRGRPELSMSAKGLEFPGYDPRGVLGQALGYATSNRGGCHLRAYMVAPEIIGKPKLIDRTTFRGKAGLVTIFQNFSAASDSLVLCKFSSFALGDEECANMLSAAVGYEYSSEEFLLVGERIWNLERLYNLKAGLTCEDDTLPSRFFETGIEPGEFLKTLQEYYRYRGWSREGVPTRLKLEQMGILEYGGDVAV